MNNGKKDRFKEKTVMINKKMNKIGSNIIFGHK